ncbi:AAA family ATPase [Nocardia sp. 2]|uniref:AAA family ATPase n=1 Tax=Nocardia acididurans TaxID=2802282 RepID=A0ABS1MEV6_9NOCA|nr:LuxR family transcriptional regulator [Nocardia acididurans]MBL1079183.1 AAA family ATPase [Nocardia acididurans]
MVDCPDHLSSGRGREHPGNHGIYRVPCPCVTEGSTAIERTFVGRAPELATLETTFDPGGPWLLLVDGPAGIGKTRLITEFRQTVTALGIRLLAVPATEFEQSTPLHVAAEIIDQLPAAAAAPASDTAAEVVDESACVSGTVADVLAEGDTRELVRRLRSGLASEPTLLIVDDAQWVDDASLRVLAALLRTRPTGFRVLFAYREGQFPAALAAGVRALGPAGRHVRVPALTLDETAALLPEYAPRLRRRLLTTSHGNPLYLLLLAEMPESDWDTVDYTVGDHASLDRTLRAELEQLPELERVTAQALAVCGPTGDLELLAATARLTRAESATGVDELARRGWVISENGRLDLRHPLVRAAAYRMSGPAWRAEAHTRAAVALRIRGVPPLARARHLEHAVRDRDAQAVADLLRAAEDALPTAPADSARWLAAALDALPASAADDHIRATLLLGRSLLLSGAPEQAVTALEPLIRRPGPQQAEALLLYARCERMLGRVDSARTLLTTATHLPGTTPCGAAQLELAILELQDNRAGDSAARLAALCGTSAACPSGDRISDLAAGPAYGTAGVVIDLAGGGDVGSGVGVESVAGVDPAVHAAALAHRALGWINELRIDLAVADYRAAVAEFDALTDGQVREVAHAVAALSWAAFFLDAQAVGIEYADRVIRLSRRSGRSFALPELFTVRAYSLLKLGRLDEALAAAEDAAEAARLFRYPDIAAMAMVVELRVRQLISPREEVLARWHTLDAMPRPVMLWWRGVVEAALREVGARLGMPAAAKPESAQVDRPHPMRATELSLAAHAALAAGRIDAACDKVSAAAAAAARVGLDSQTAAALFARAAYRAATDDLTGAEIDIRAALAAFDRADMPLHSARALLLAAEIAGRRGDFTAATTQIAAARTEFATVGAHELVAEARSAQRRLAGMRSKAGAVALTAREREIAELAAQGHSNRDIATQLYLSPRTVEDHLGRILRKLGLTGRAGIARRLHDFDPPQP